MLCTVPSYMLHNLLLLIISFATAFLNLKSLEPLHLAAGNSLFETKRLGNSASL